MILNKKTLLSGIFSLIITLFATAQDQRTLNTKIADILNEMPTENLERLENLLDQMIALEEEGMLAFTDQLTPLGDDNDDTRHRMALESLSRKLSVNPASDEAQWYMGVLKKSFERETDNEIKTFLMRRMNAIATDDDLEFLIEKAKTESHRKPALAVVASIGSVKAESSLVSMLTSDDNVYTDVLKTLDDLGSEGGIESAITQLSGASGKKKQVILQYLANSGAPRAFEALKNEASASGYKPDNLNTVKSFLTYGENTDASTRSKVVKEVLKNTGNPNQMGFRTRAMAMSLTGEDAKSATKTLVKEFRKSNNKSYRVALLNLAESYTGEDVLKRWGKTIKKSSPAQKAEILHSFYKRGDASTLEYIPDSFTDEEVAGSAFMLRAKIQGKEAIDPILKGMENNDFAEEGYSALQMIVSRDELNQIADYIPNLPPASKVEMINLIARRKGTDQFEVVETHLSDINAMVRTASHQALKHISNRDDIDELTRLLDLATQENVKYISEALIVAINDLENKSDRESVYFDLLKSTKKKAAIIAISPKIGGSKVMDLILDEFRNGSVKDAAFQAIINWEDPMIAPVLFSVLSSAPEGSKVRNESFNGYLDLCNLNNIPEDQRVLMLRKLMPYAGTTTQKIKVIQSLGRARTFLSFVFVSKFLDDAELQQAASRAVMNIALPKPGEKMGLTGPDVVSALEKSIEVMEGPESQYAKEDIRVYLRNMNKTQGFVSMFNGDDLQGWQGFVANPIALSKMTPAEKAKKQEEADKKARENWSVDDGQIVFDGKGQNLVSVKEYGDFEMYVDWRITEGGDSGIYLRGTPQIQIWDTSRVNVGAQVGSGGLYNNKKNPSKPLKVADNPIGEWNTFYIKMVGEKVTVKLNGHLVVDDVVLENYWNRSEPIFPNGSIELQAHGSDLGFRNIYIRELSSPDFSITPEEKAEGFTSLFNGKDLTGWVGNKTDYFAENGIIVVNPDKGGHGNLYTEKEYSNFVFRFEFQLTPGANNGLGIHTSKKGDAAYSAKELQILDNTASIYANLKEYQYHGSIYGVVAAKRGFLSPVGEWNKQEVIVDGDRIKITLNGEVILDADYVEASKNGTLDGRDHPGLDRKKGHIGFLGHGSKLKFRNIRIKEL